MACLPLPAVRLSVPLCQRCGLLDAGASQSLAGAIGERDVVTLSAFRHARPSYNRTGKDVARNVQDVLASVGCGVWMATCFFDASTGVEDHRSPLRLASRTYARHLDGNA